MRFSLLAYTLTFLCWATSFLNAQTLQETYCAADAQWEKYLAQHPDLAHQEQSSIGVIEDLTHDLWERRLNGQCSREGDEMGLITIPVAVHIMHPSSESIGAGGNITNAQVETALDHLNQAFRNTLLFDPTTGVDVEIEFCLAARDPNGNATNGITRHTNYYNVDLGYNADTVMKHNTAWDQTQYLNIWVVKTIQDFGRRRDGHCRQFHLCHCPRHNRRWNGLPLRLLRNGC